MRRVVKKKRKEKSEFHGNKMFDRISCPAEAIQLKWRHGLLEPMTVDFSSYAGLQVQLQDLEILVFLQVRNTPPMSF
jgi:hypothetical protein